jgi:hypothetical protein
LQKKDKATGRSITIAILLEDAPITTLSADASSMGFRIQPMMELRHCR